MGKLTDKQRLFIDYYLGEARCNGAEAARLAGYSEKTARNIATENLSKPHIRERITAALEARALPQEAIAALLGKQATVNIGDFLNDDGSANWQAIKDKGAGLIRKITVKDGQVTLELYDGQAALGKLDEIYNRTGASNEWILKVVHE